MNTWPPPDIAQRKRLHQMSPHERAIHSKVLARRVAFIAR